MNSIKYNSPMLTEPGVKYFINETLKQCRQFKENHQHIIFNICLLVMFFIILGVFLFYKYKGKLSEEEIKQKELLKKQYILSKIRIFRMPKLNPNKN
jgi:hypothetical protein